MSRRFAMVLCFMGVLLGGHLYCIGKVDTQAFALSEAFLKKHHSRMEQLLERLDLDREGLSAVKDAMEDQHVGLACRLLLEYYQKRGMDAELLPKPIAGYGDATRERAQAALDDVFYAQDVAGKPPAREDGLYDWSYQGPDDTMEWAWFFNRHNCFRDMYLMWEETGDARYPEKISVIVKDWVEANRVPRLMSFSPAWRALEAARRIEGPWVEVFFRLQDEPAFSAEARLMLLSSIPDHGNYLMKHHALWGNHKITEMMALLQLALAWPEFQESPKWLDYAVTTLVEQLYAQSYPDGSYKELANHYQRVALMSFQRAANLLHAAGRSDKAVVLEERLTLMWAYFMGVARPSGWGPLNSDSDQEHNHHYYERYREPYENTPLDYKGTLPTHFYPWAGHAVMRQDWSDESLWAFFDVGPHGTDHQHADRLHVSVSLGRFDVLVDAGRYTYEPGRVRDYYQGAASHNLVLWHGLGSQAPPHEVSEPLPVRAEMRADADMFEATVRFPAKVFSGQGGAEHTRRVIFQKKGYKTGYWVVVDHLKSYGVSRWNTRWHFHPDCNVEIIDGIARASLPSGQQLAVIPIGFTSEVSVLSGVTGFDYAGWYSREFNYQRPSVLVDFETWGQEPKSQVWLLLPVMSHDALPSVTILHEGFIGIKWGDGHYEVSPISFIE